MQNRFDKKAYDFFVDSEILDFKGFRRLRNAFRGRSRPGLGKRGRRALLSARFDPNARDADNDGIIQEMTRWERPAGPRNIIQPLRSPSSIAGDDDSEDLDALLRNLERNRQRNRPFRLTAPDDDSEPDKPSRTEKPITPGRRDRPLDRSRLIDPRKPVTADNIRNPKILPSTPNPGKPMVAEIRRMSKTDWNELVNSYEDYWLGQQETINKRGRKAYALFALRSALKGVKVTNTEDGIELNGTDWDFARIVKGLEELKKRGTEFDNGDKIIKYLESQMKRQGRSSRTIDLDQYRRIVNLPSNNFRLIQDDRRDVKKVVAEVNGLEKKVERAFGKIETKQDALSAFQRAHPEIQKHFDFLWGQTGPLSSSERGVVLGYLNMFLEHPELKNYTIKFSPEKMPGAGGSASYEVPWDNDNLRDFDKIRLTLRYRVNETGLSLSDLTQPRGGLFQDTVARQAAVAYIKANPDGLSDADLLERAQLIYDSKIAEHEATHIAHYIKTIEDAFPGKNADGKAIMDAVRALIASEGREGAASNHFVGRAVNLLDITDDSVAASESILKEFDKNFRDIKNQERQRKKRDLYPSEIKYIENWLVAQIVLPNGQWSEHGQIWQKHLPLHRFDASDPASIEKTFSRKNLLAGVNFARAQKRALEKMLDEPKYKDLNDLYEELKQNRQILGQDIFGNVVMSRPEFEIIGLKFPDLMRELWQDVMAKTQQNGIKEYLDIFDDFDIYTMALQKILSAHWNDDLNPKEQKLLRKLGKQISLYAEAIPSQFYNYQQAGSPVEAIAELTGALTSGQKFEKGTSLYNAVKKFVIWLKGPTYWDKIEEQYG